MGPYASLFDRFGEVKIEEDAVVLRRSPSRFVRSQIAAWNAGGVKNRAAVLWYAGVLVVTPVIAANALYLGLLSDVWYASGVWRVFYVGMGIVIIGGFLRRFQSRRIPMANLSHGVTAVGGQSLRLPPRSLGTLTFWAGMNNPKITFISSDHRDRAAGLLDNVGVEVSSEHTDAKYKFFKGGGGYYCPTCDAAVSRRDTYCDSCQTQLREDVAY